MSSRTHTCRRTASRASNLFSSHVVGTDSGHSLRPLDLLIVVFWDLWIHDFYTVRLIQVLRVVGAHIWHFLNFRYMCFLLNYFKVTGSRLCLRLIYVVFRSWSYISNVSGLVQKPWLLVIFYFESSTTVKFLVVIMTRSWYTSFLCQKDFFSNLGHSFSWLPRSFAHNSLNIGVAKILSPVTVLRGFVLTGTHRFSGGIHNGV